MSDKELSRLTPSDVRYTDHGMKLLESFNAWYGGAVIEEKPLDQGVYRHITFRVPNKQLGSRFSLVTWPGHLAAVTPHGTYTFARVHDMFDFFDGYINTDYWAEKLQSGITHGSQAVTNHDPELFKKWVIEDFWENRELYSPRDARIWWQDLKENVLDDYTYIDLHDVNDCIRILRDLDDQPHDYYYDDVWGSARSWEQHDWHFEMALAFIVTGIRTYKEQK